MPDFCHLHCHTQFSLLDGAADIDKMLYKAKNDEQKAVAITDHGNMFGAFKFYASAMKIGLKPIIGCEFYVVEDRFQKTFNNQIKDKRYHQLLLAKNPTGYKNLSKLCSLGFIEGLYGTFPRIDMGLIRQYSEGLIATTCCVAAMVPRTFLDEGPEAAEKVFLEFLEIFGEDYYVEIQRHGIKGIDQEGANQFLLGLAKKHGVKIIATNDSHYVERKDYEAHDILLCVNTGDFKATPKGDGKGFRFGFENDQFYFKTKAEMLEAYSDIPEALDNTIEIVDKIETPKLKRDVLLPNFVLPAGFETQLDYLRHLTYEGARKKYGELTSEVTERLDFELKVIGDMGFAGYFLIVADFINAARELNVAVGPGRGSAAGSAVAFCTGITNIDPIRYNLLFERFLNPERVSMPDIDTDFDDEGRQKVIDYVVDKYGKKQVAQIITYGTMAAKSSIKDVGRVLQLPLADTDRLSKMVPDGVGMTLSKAFEDNPDLRSIKENQQSLEGQVLALAELLEGSVRNRGVHAAGVIIAPDDLTDYIPVCTAKDSDLLVTQFDGKVIEEAGMLKMDFLGLKTLTIIRDAIDNIRETRGIHIEPDDIPLDDPKTFELYQRGDTIGTFQFESEGMRQYLKELRPTDIEDLIAMNALYRPGPMDYIPSFIARKHGREKVEYPHEWLEPILNYSYGIMVYQEQIMQTAQVMGGFSLGKADLLRRAMGKKDAKKMAEMKEEFVNGAKAKGVDEKKADEVFGTMEKFASYGFNRSHSAAYSVLAFQTAYLKANYPSEYMAAVLTHNMSDIKQVNFFLSESKRMGLTALGPDVNESNVKFTVNKAGEIRFALSAIKGVGEAAVEALVQERKKNGPYSSIFDLAKRATGAINKKTLESLASAGALDCFPDTHRGAYFAIYPNEGMNVIEKAVKFASQYSKGSAAAVQNLFGETMVQDIEEPNIPQAPKWSLLETLKKELEYTGIYLSGHPLDNYAVEIEHFVTCKDVTQIEQYKNRDISVAGIVVRAVHKTSQKGDGFAFFTIEDYNGTLEMSAFKEKYAKWKHLLQEGYYVYVKGRYKYNEFYKKDEFEVANIELLAEVKDRLTKRLSIKIDLHRLNASLIDQLHAHLQERPGPAALDISVIDPEEKTEVRLQADKLKVSVDNDLVRFIKNAGWRYGLS
ncbi:MAG: DNA polymerase III subunit alpha [Chitinophagales bacterium]|nr:DNA polymerase III subunit alpha [Chitinophagales bacterium]